MKTQTIYDEFYLKGHGSLSDNSLLKLILNDRNIDYETLPSLSKISAMDKYDLINNGLTEKQAIKILSVFEINRRIIYKEKKQITCSGDIYEIAASKLLDLSYEEFWTVLLNRANKIIDIIKISQGGTVGTVVDNKIILKHAINNMASGIALFHNHPSGNKQPSSSDRDITNKIKQALDLMDILLIDHVIIAGKDNYFSFADENIL